MQSMAVIDRSGRSGMKDRTIAPSQQIAGRAAGFLYLVTMATAVFAEVFVRGRLIVRNDAVQTAENIAAAERLFRIGVVSDLVTYAGVIALVVALYVILAPIHRGVALLAACWRLVENGVLIAVTLNLYAALLFLSGAEYLRPVDPEQLQALARAFIGVWGTGHRIGMVFLGLGSAVFSLLWFKSRYVPRVLAAWGIVSSLVLAIVTLVILVFPPVGPVVGLSYMAPMGIYEVGLGLWLLVKGIPSEQPIR